jgi:hypothetical protein
VFPLANEKARESRVDGNNLRRLRYWLAGNPKGDNVMTKYLIATGLIVAFASPALAADYYVALKIGGGGCVIMDHKPGPKYKNMGSFSSRSMAKKAMHEMSDCK